ncbi:hypothetical protein ES705_10536 [subsurface metagenome]
MKPDSRYVGGNIWMSPSYSKSMIVCGKDGRLFLISDPAEQGSTIVTEHNGTWLYTMPELKERLKNWTWVGTHLDYIADLITSII